MLFIPIACLLLVVIVGAASAADSSIISGAPAWLNGVLALVGVAGIGGTGVFAGIAKKVAATEAKYLPIVQGLKNAIDKDAALFSELKAIVASSVTAVPSWNAAMDANASLFKEIPLGGISAKADTFSRLKITLPVATPAIITKVEAVAAKVEEVVDKAENIAANIPTQAQ